MIKILMRLMQINKTLSRLDLGERKRALLHRNAAARERLRESSGLRQRRPRPTKSGARPKTFLARCTKWSDYATRTD